MSKITIQNPDYPFEVVHTIECEAGQATPLLSHFAEHGLSLHGRAFACEMVNNPNMPSHIGNVTITVARGLKLHHSTRHSLPRQFAIYLDDCEDKS